MRWYSFAVMLLYAVLLAQFSGKACAGDKNDSGKNAKKENNESANFVVRPNGGKEVKLLDWRFTLGTRRFALSQKVRAEQNAKTLVQPEYLLFREDKSTTFHDGILTLIPLTSVRKIDYDREKKTVSVTAVKAAGQDETLTATTRYVGINKIVVEADVILEGLGAATMKFQGGVDKGLQSIRFPLPKPVEEVKGAVVTIIAQDKEKTNHVAYGLQPLYLIDGESRILPYLMFKRTVKIDMDKITSLRFNPSEDTNANSNDYEVTLKDRAKHTLTLLTKIAQENNKSMVLEGLVGRVAAGYKLFPLHTIQELQVLTDEKAKK